MDHAIQIMSYLRSLRAARRFSTESIPDAVLHDVLASIYPEVNKQRAHALLGVPARCWVHTAISFGYPADARALRLSAERGNLADVPIGRKDLSDLVSWERYGAH